MDKLIVSANGQTTISNDGATILKLLEITHPAAQALVDISRAQDAEVGDGTTTVVLLAAELLRESKAFIEDGVSPHVIIKGYRRAAQLVRLGRWSFFGSHALSEEDSLKPPFHFCLGMQAVQRVKDIAVTIERTNEAYVLAPLSLYNALTRQGGMVTVISEIYY